MIHETILKNMSEVMRQLKETIYGVPVAKGENQRINGIFFGYIVERQRTGMGQ